MPTPPADLSDAMHTAAASLLASSSELRSAVAVAVECNGLRCVITLGPADATPTLPKGSRKKDGDRTACKRDILTVMESVTVPLIRKKVVAALRDANTPHPPGTVAKALADLTAAGELVNPRDRKGYRLAIAWQRSLTPSLFGEGD